MKTEHKKTPATDPRAEYEAWFEAQVRLGVEDIEAGRVVSDELATEHMQRLREKLRAADGMARAA